MLLPINRLIDFPVMSLQTGMELARITEPIIDPRNLMIVAFYVTGARLETDPSVLHVDDIRELSDIGIIVDNSDVLMPTDDLVRLQQILDFNFVLINLKVIDETGRKLGKVMDYSIDAEGYSIQQLYTKQSLLRSISTTSNIIHRSQIISVTNQRIVVKSGRVRHQLNEHARSTSQFINPFRGSAQPERIIPLSASDESIHN